MLAYNPAANPLNNNEWAFPLTECFHIAAMAFSIGTIVLVDLRLLGRGLKRQTAARLAAQMEWWTLAGLMVVITSGLVIFSSDPPAYLRNPSFLFKMKALAAATVYNYTVRRMAVKSSGESPASRVAGAVSIALWCSVVAAGIFIAFV
jgi:hypothetical protein